MSFTKSLVPRSPSGINLVCEVDIFYPLQTQIKDWYPTKKPIPVPKPVEPEDEDDDDDSKQPLAGNIGPMVPSNLANPNQQFNGNPPDANPPDANPPDAPNSQFLPTPSNQMNFQMNRLPSDQELGITPGTIISDPNFNVGSHPGEIYIKDKNRVVGKNPPRRYDSYYSSKVNYYKDLLSQQNNNNRYYTVSLSFKVNDDWCLLTWFSLLKSKRKEF